MSRDLHLNFWSAYCLWLGRSHKRQILQADWGIED